MIGRMFAVMVLVIVGSIAAQELYKALTPLIPLLIIITVVLFVAGGYIKTKRKL